jgi:hypothetical protein
VTIRGWRYPVDSEKGPWSYMAAQAAVAIRGKPRRVTSKILTFTLDSASSVTVLGTEAVESLGLKKYHMRGISPSTDFAGHSIPSYRVPGIVNLRHKRRPLHLSVLMATFSVNFAIPPAAFGAGNAGPVDSLLGQDVLEHLTKTGERRDRARGIDWEFYEIKPRDDGTDRIIKGRYEGMVLSDEFFSGGPGAGD